MTEFGASAIPATVAPPTFVAMAILQRIAEERIASLEAWLLAAALVLAAAVEPESALALVPSAELEAELAVEPVAAALVALPEPVLPLAEALLAQRPQAVPAWALPQVSAQALALPLRRPLTSIASSASPLLLLSQFVLAAQESQALVAVSVAVLV